MKITTTKQRSPEWFEETCGSIGGTRLGQVISGRKNRLLFDIINERLNGYQDIDDFITEDMQFGIDNEPIAAKLYEEKAGIEWKEIGTMKSELAPNHHASPDRISTDETKVLEIKCTQNGAIHIQRFFDGPESTHMPQIINYFAIDDKIKEVHWVSYCPYRPERQLVIHIFTAEMLKTEILHARKKLGEFEAQVKEATEKFIF